MTAFTAISGAAAAVRSLITTNATALGGVVEVRDRDEDPAVIANSIKVMPIVCVIPLGDKSDTITFTMGANNWIHSFEIRIIGYYPFSQDNKDVFSDLATVRQYAFDTIELFRGGKKAAFYPGANATGATIQLGYQMVTDYVIYRFDIGLKCTMYETV